MFISEKGWGLDSILQMRRIGLRSVKEIALGLAAFEGWSRDLNLGSMIPGVTRPIAQKK